MIGYVYISESPYFAKTGSDGTAVIVALPPRAYVGATDAIESCARSPVGNGQRTCLNHAMTDDRHERPVVDHNDRAAPAASGTSNTLIRREKSTAAATDRAVDTATQATTAERHRAWLRHVGRRER